MIITLIIIFNQIVSVFDINKLVTYKHKLLKSYSRENFHKLISMNQYLFYIFFKNLYLNSISSFIPLICKKLFKTQPYFYISTNIQLFLFIHIVSCLGLVFNQEIGSLIDYYYSDTNSLYHAKEYADIILNDDNLKKEALHVDLPDDIQTAKFYKKITQIVLCCVALGLIYLNNNP